MAGRHSLPEVDLTCPICCEIFREPVVLKCSHSFCAACLRQYWTPGRSRDCPLCRAPSLDDPVPSLTLKNLCEAYVEDSEGLQEAGAGELYCDPGEMCPSHGERLKLFCLLDKEPICVVCHTSRRHKQHDCCPVSEAVGDVKVDKCGCHLFRGCCQPVISKVNVPLFNFPPHSGENEVSPELSAGEEGRLRQDEEKLRGHRGVHRGVRHPAVFYMWRSQRCFQAVLTPLSFQIQARFVERRTREEFDKLHSFLQAEEEAQMAALAAEEEQRRRAMMQKIEEITREITSVSESIRVLEEEIVLDGISVLHVRFVNVSLSSWALL